MKKTIIIACIALFSLASCGESNQETTPTEALVVDTTECATQETITPAATNTAATTTSAVPTATN